MRTALRAISARLIVGRLEVDSATDLLDVVEAQGKAPAFMLAEPEAMVAPTRVGAGTSEVGQTEAIRLGKLVLETVANEYLASTRSDPCDALADGLSVAHRRLGPDGLALAPRGGCGVGFCSAVVVDRMAQLVIVPPSQAFILHQGTVQAIPEAGPLGRSIWMRDDLRAEVFAGIGSTHEPEIRIYEAGVGPGDTLLLLSSTLARMLSEDDLRRALTYEEAAVGAERLRQLALERGVESGLALVIEVAASANVQSTESGAQSPATDPLSGVQSSDSGVRSSDSFDRLSRTPGSLKASRRLEAPPIGAIFATARQRLLDALERIQTSAAPNQAHKHEPQSDREIPWPRRPRPGQQPSSDVSSASADERPKPESPYAASHSNSRSEHQAQVTGQRPGSRRAVSAAFQRPNRQLVTGTLQRLGTQRVADVLAALPGKLKGHHASLRAKATKSHFPVAGANMPAMTSGSRSPIEARHRRSALGARWSALSTGRPALGLVGPALIAVIALGLILLGVRTVRSQQQQQLEQRFDSLTSAAQQLEGQARTTAGREEAQNLIHRAQALLDQAATLHHDQAPVIALRKALLVDLDRLNNVYELPDPTIVTSFGGSSHGTATGLAGDSSVLYVLDRGQGKIFQVMRVQKTATPVVSKGDKVGQSQVGNPELLARSDDGSILILDGDHHLWKYQPSKAALVSVALAGTGNWKSVTDMTAYGPNLYVLDSAGGNILRYVPKDGQYSNAPSRFFDSDNKVPLGQAVSMAIDGSIWLVTSDGHVLKLAGGQAQPFSITGLAQPLSHATAIFTSADTHSVYVLDASAGRVVQLSKEGAYQRQLSLGLSQSASKLWVDEVNRNLYVVAGNKLYSYQLPL